ncbi:type II secretion system protein GspM [Parasphingorhabdus sp.]|jgi:general secretion pathway protein M|uniref:type II secretion system protein GspM n=1 Tax=Parasphingorhabdus sp. TaxID=2709688 RepID=UPI003D2E5543
MIESLTTWFLALSRREKILIGILAILLGGTVAVYGIYRPMAGAIDRAEERYTQSVERQARIESKVAALKKPDADAPRSRNGAIDLFVSQTAGETGIAVGKIELQGDDRVNLVVDSAKPTALFGWLARIEADGVGIETLTVSPAGNGTVSANLTLRAN